MTKSTRNIVIIAAVIVLLLAGIIVINTVDFSKDDDSQESDTEQSYTIFSKDTSDLTSVTVKTENSVLTAENTDGVWTINGMSGEDIDKSKAYTLASTVSTIISKNKIEERASDLAQYGLDKPSVTAVIRSKDGSENTLYIGDKSPTLGEYFIRLNDDTGIYTLYSYKVDTLMQPLSYYSDFNRFSVNIDDITAIRIERDGETIKLRIAEDISKTTNNVWELILPYESSANDEYIDNNVLADLEKLSFNVIAGGEDDYGTDNPSVKITLTIKPYDSTTGKYGEEYEEMFEIGKIENEKAYVKYNGRIYEVSAEAVDFANASAFNILNKLQALVDISTVNSFAVTANGRTDSIEISRDGDDMSFMIGGAKTDAKTARQMYQAMISLAVDGIYRGETLGDTVLAFDFEGIKPESDVKIEFKSINDLSCALVRNGKAEFTIKNNKLEEFKKLWTAYVTETTGERSNINE